jgi:DNA segregation ATPase FtsK/SpoIIIE-like protein
MKTRQVVLVTGKTGSGKSTLFREMILSQERFIIFDTLSEYRGLSPSYPALFIADIQSLLDYLNKNAGQRNLRIVFDPEDPDRVYTMPNGETLTLFDLTCKAIYEGLENITLGIEELANFVQSNYCPEYLRKIVRFGRHSSISLMATTQRPPEMPPMIRAQITKFISFKQHEPRDIDWISRIIGQDAFTLKDLDQFVWGKPMLRDRHYKEYEL